MAQNVIDKEADKVFDQIRNHNQEPMAEIVGF
jgi:hypothetical protein